MTKKQSPPAELSMFDKETGEIIDGVHPAYKQHQIISKNQYNAEQFPAYYEINGSPSETIPDQTMSLKTLLERHARGLPITGNNSEPVYNGDQEMPDLNKMDISEIHALKMAIKSDIQKMQTKLANEQQATRQAAHEKTINDEVEKRVKDHKQDQKSHIPGDEK